MTIYINDIRQDYRHTAFFSPSSAGLGYATISTGDSVDDITPYDDNGGIPEGLTSKEWTRICDNYERYLYEHRHELEINPAGHEWEKFFEEDRAKR